MNHYFKERIKLESHNPKQIHNPRKTWKLRVNLGFGTMGRRGLYFQIPITTRHSHHINEVLQF